MKNGRVMGPNAPKSSQARGAVSRAICQAYGTIKPIEIAARLATDLLYRTQITGPPFSPMEYARSLGIPVKYGSIEADGVFTDTETAQSVFRGTQSDIDFAHMSKGPTIILKDLKDRQTHPTGSVKRRENFTLAHELGHYIIRSAIAGVTPVKHLPSDDPEEERLCNAFAEELLMPARYIQMDLASDNFDTRRLLWLSDRYQVSVQAMACRVNRFFRGNVACIMWENVRGWHTAKWATPLRLRRALLCNTGNTTVEMAAQSGQPASGRDDLLIDGERMRWMCESRLLPNRGATILTVMWRSSTALNRARQDHVPLSRTVSTPLFLPAIPVQGVLPFFE